MALTFSVKGSGPYAADDIASHLAPGSPSLSTAIHIRTALFGVRCPKHGAEPRSIHYALGVSPERATAVADCGDDGECVELDREIDRLVRNS